MLKLKIFLHKLFWTYTVEHREVDLGRFHDRTILVISKYTFNCGKKCSVEILSLKQNGD